MELAEEGIEKKATDGRIRVLRLDSPGNRVPKNFYGFPEAIRMIRNQLIGKRVTRKLTSGGMFLKRENPITRFKSLAKRGIKVIRYWRI